MNMQHTACIAAHDFSNRPDITPFFRPTCICQRNSQVGRNFTCCRKCLNPTLILVASLTLQAKQPKELYKTKSERSAAAYGAVRVVPKLSVSVIVKGASPKLLASQTSPYRLAMRTVPP